VVSRTCQEVVVQKEQLASFGQASVEFVQADNSIPKVSGIRILRFRGVSLHSSGLDWLFAIFQNSDPKLLSKNFLTPFYNGAGLGMQGYTRPEVGVSLIHCNRDIHVVHNHDSVRSVGRVE
jgi:hypothetical protein